MRPTATIIDFAAEKAKRRPEPNVWQAWVRLTLIWWGIA